MNVDLKKLLETAKEHFPNAVISSNVVEFTKSDLSWEDMNHLSKLVIDYPHSRPWVFRSGKGVRVVIFTKDDEGYHTSIHNDLPVKFSYWLMENCELSEDATIWSYHGEDYDNSALFEIFKKELNVDRIESDLVSFGNFLLKSRSTDSEVTHADLENWKHEQSL